MSEAARRNVALACRVLADNGLDDKIWGHVSIRDAQDRGVWLKRAEIGLNEVTPDDVQLVSWTGDVLHGHGDRHSEWPIHTGVMRTREDVNSVVHAHPEDATALGASGVPLRPISHEGCCFGGRDVPRFDEVTRLITTPDLGKRVATTLGDRDALLLVNHGIVTAGTDHRDAVFRAITLEVGARKQRKTQEHGGMPSWTSLDEAKIKQDQIYTLPAMHAAWAYLVRQLPNPIEA